MNKILLKQIIHMSKNVFYGFVFNSMFCMIVYAEDARGQTSMNETPVSITVDKVELTDVFSVLTDKTGFNFTYNDAVIDPQTKISLLIENGSLFDVLSKISKMESLHFKRIDNNIHVAKATRKSDVGVFVQEAKITVSGKITDQSGSGVPGATILVKGTSTGTTTDIDGNFSLEVDEEATLVISFLGYKTVETNVQSRTTIDIALEEDINTLNEVIVTATGIRRKVEMGNTISRLAVEEDVKIRPISNVSDLLQGQASGVQIFGSGGSTGMGSKIRIRGSNSASLSNEPVVYVDGVLINNNPNSISFETGGQTPSRFNDINPEDIESIEVIKGPSAATLYGSIAANGVIRITTKKGKKGKPRWSAYTETGLVEDVGNYPLNYQSVDAAGVVGFNFQIADGTFTPVSTATLQPLNEKSTSPFRKGNLFGAGLSVSGGNDALTYFLSGSFSDNEGVLPVNNYQKASFRANFGAQVTEKLKVNFSSGYVKSTLELPLNDNFSLGLMGQGLSGNTNPEVNRGWGEFKPKELFTIDTRQDINRFTSGLEANWAGFENFNLRVAGGLDFTSRWDNQFFPTGEAPAFNDFDQGAKFSNRFTEITSTIDVVGSYNGSISESISLRSSLGFQYLSSLTEGTLSTGLGLVAGTNSIAGAASTFSNEQTTEQRTAGVFLEEQVGFNDKLFVTGAIRSDRGSAFGAALDAVVYPKVSASWVMSDESFFPEGNALGSFRLRGAWGESGVQPGTNDALRFFTPIAATVTGQDVTGVTFGGVGNDELQPERSREFEFGFDGLFFTDKISLEFTYFNKQTEDALIFRQLPQSLGVGTGRFENLGSVKNTGVEIALNTNIYESKSIGFDINFIAAFLDNELVELGQGIEPVIFGIQRHTEGFALGGYWDETYTFSDSNGDGYIAESEVTLSDEVAYLGAPFATTDLSIMPAINLLDNQFIIRALLNYRDGQKLYNNTAAWRIGNGATDEVSDPNASLKGQARAVASRLGTNAGYIEDASFWRLREVSLTYNLPEKILGSLGVSRASLTISGQNLGVWTDYSGLDPEISSAGQSNFTTQEFLSQPPVRMWKARINLTF